MKAVWKFLKGRKRNIGLTLTLILGWATAQGYVPPHLNQLGLALLTAWGVVAVADSKKKETPK